MIKNKTYAGAIMPVVDGATTFELGPRELKLIYNGK